VDAPGTVPLVWQRVLTEYASGMLDAADVWTAIDEYSVGVAPEPRWLPVHPPDLADPEEAALVREQAAALYDLLQRHAAGSLSADDLASEAMDVLGVSPDDDA
jgi:hypothetical protein